MDWKISTQKQTEKVENKIDIKIKMQFRTIKAQEQLIALQKNTYSMINI